MSDTAAKKEDVLDNLNSSVFVRYANAELPAIKGASKPTNPEKTITIDGMRKSGDDFIVSPTLKEGTTQGVYTATLSLAVGSEMSSSSEEKPYILYLEIPAQGLKYDKDSNEYEVVDEAMITLSLKVTRMADVVRLKPIEELTAEGGAFDNDYDRYTLVDYDKDGLGATLTLTLGKGEPGATVSYTHFRLSDLLVYYYGSNGVPKDRTDDERAQNYASLKIELNTSHPATAWDGENEGPGHLVVPGEETAGNGVKYIYKITTKNGVDGYTFTLTVEYRITLYSITMKDSDPNARKAYYTEGAETKAEQVITEDLTVRTVNNTVLDLDNPDKKMDAANMGNYINFPNYMHIALCVVHEDGTAYVLPRATIGDSVYYFALNASEEEMQDKENAYFRTGSTNYWTNRGNVWLTKDIFAIDYLNLETAFTMYQHLRVYFYYGDSAEDALHLESFENKNEKDAKKNKIYQYVTVELDEPNVAFVNYELYRKLNRLEEYTTEDYDEVAVPTSQDPSKRGATGIHSSGAPFYVYVTGIIEYEGGEPFIVNKDKKLAENFHLETLATPVISCQGVGNSSVDHQLTYDDKFDRFTAECDSGKRHNECGTITFSASVSKINEIVIRIGVSRQDVPIQKIEFFASDPSQPSPEAYETKYLFTNGTDGEDTLTVYYRVTYEEYIEGTHLAMDAFSFYIDDVPIDTSKAVFSAAYALPSFSSPTSMTAEYGNPCIFVGTLTLTLQPGAANGHYKITCCQSPTSVNANTSIYVDVTTRIAMASFTAENERTNRTAGVGTTLFEVDYLPQGDASANTYDFIFNFTNADGTMIDRQYLTYALAGAEGLSGVKLTLLGVPEKDPSSLTKAECEAVTGFRIALSGGTVNAKKLTITVTESDPSKSTSQSYKFEIELSVDMPISTIALKVGETQLNHEGTVSVETLGREDDSLEEGKWAKLLLTPVYNGNAEGKTPLKTPAVTYALTSADNAHLGVYEVRQVGGDFYLYINQKATTAPADVTLKLTVTGKHYDGREITNGSQSIEIHLQWEGTKKLSIAFENEKLQDSYVQTDNEALDFAVVVKNAAQSSGEKVASNDPNLSYAVTNENGVSTTLIGTSVKPTGASGSYTVTATYNNPKDDKDVLTISATITVAVKATQIKLWYGVGNSPSLVNLVAGQQNCILTVEVLGLNGAPAKDTRFTAKSEHDEYCEVTEGEGIVTLNPRTAGETVITVTSVSEPDVSATLTVKVYEAQISLESTNATYDIFTNSLPAFTLHLTGADAFRLDTLQEVQFTVENAEGVFELPQTSNVPRAVYTLSYTDKATLTDAAIRTYTVRISATLNGVPLSATAQFALTKQGYAPAIVLKYNGAVKEELNLSNATGYTIALNNQTTVLGTPTVVFTASPEVLTFGENGVVSFNGATVGEVTVSATVTLASGGLTIPVESVVYNIVDSASISSTVRVGASNPLSGGAKPTSLEAFGDPVANDGSKDIGFAEADGDRYLSLITDFTSAPAAVAGITSVEDFKVSGKTKMLTQVNTDILTIGNRKYFVVVYHIEETGTVSLQVRTKEFGGIGGVFYSAESVSVELTAVKPVFKLTRTGNDTLLPGETFTAEVTGGDAEGFLGNVTYTFSASGILTTQTVVGSPNKLTVTVPTGLGGGKFTVTCEVEITSGFYQGTVERHSVEVSVQPFKAPTATAKSIVGIAQGGEQANLATLITVTGDSREPEGVSFAITGAKATLEGASVKESDGIYTYHAPSEVSANGAADTIVVELKITTGYYKNYTLTVRIAVTIKPSATLSVSAGPAGENGAVTYTLTGADDATYAAVARVGAELVDIASGASKNQFTVTPKKNTEGGTVVLAFSMTLTGEPYAGTVIEALEPFTVAPFAVEVGEPSAQAGSYTYTVTAKNGERVTYSAKIVEGNKLAELVGPSGTGSNEFVLTPKTDTAGGVVVIEFTGTVQNAAGEGDVTSTVRKSFTVKAQAPWKGITVSESNNIYTVTVVGWSGEGAAPFEYKLEVVGDATLYTLGGENYGTYDTDNAFTVKPKTSVKGGLVVLKFSAIVKSGAYEDTVFTATAAFEVKPLTFTVTKGTNNAYTAELKNIYGGETPTYFYETIAGDKLVTISGSNGAYTVTPKENTKGGVVSVTFKATVSVGGKEEKFEQTISFEVVGEKAYTGIKANAEAGDADGKTVYKVQGQGGGEGKLTYKVEVLAGADLVTVEGSTVTYGNSDSFTVTKKTNTKGGTVVLLFSAQVDGGAYDGTVFTDIVTFEVDALSLSVDPKENNKDSYTVKLENVVGGEEVTYSYELLVGEGLVTVAISDGKDGAKVYTVTRAENTLGGTAVLVIKASVNSTDFTLTHTVKLTVDPAVVPSVSASVSTSGDETKVTVSDANGYTVTVTEFVENQYVSVSKESGVITAKEGYTLSSANDGIEITVTVIAKIASAPYEGTVVTCTFKVWVKAVETSVDSDSSSTEEQNGTPVESKQNELAA